MLAASQLHVIPETTMKTYEELIQELNSTDPAIRDEAALDSMDIGNDNAVIPLIEAIRRPENENYRGTLVLALSAFNCIDHLEYLIDLCLTGDFEVSSIAFNIIEDLQPTRKVTSKIEQQLARYSIDSLPYEHSLEAYKALIQLT